MTKFNVLFSCAFALAFGFMGCSKQAAETGSATVTPGATLIASSTLPNIPGLSKGSVTVTTSELNYSNVGMVRFNDPWGSKEVTVDLGSYNSATDFGGENGSMTLVAETQNYPSTSGGAYPVLTAFYADTGAGRVEYVNTTSACRTERMWDCSNGYCDAHAACSVSQPSSFRTRVDWDQHQIPPYGYITTNAFPRCDASVNGWSSCPSTSGWGSLPTGHYYAKYVLMSDSGGNVSTKSASLKVTLHVKKDTQARNATSVNGGLNLNVILVGDQNVNDYHTAKGVRNLNLLFQEVNRLFQTTSGSKLGINQVKVYEWTNANGGDQYAQVDYASLGDLFEKGSKGVDAADAGTYVNIFLVSDIEYSNASFTILGISGAILGPPKNGTPTSGLAFSSFDKLASFNPSCATDNCGRDLLQNDFLEMAATIVHEMGHFLGLNHPSEKPDSGGVQDVDPLSDTPTCAARTSGSNSVLDQRSCFVSDTTVQPAPLSGTCASACNAVTNPSSATSSYSNTYLTSTTHSSNIDPWTSYINTDMPGKFCPQVPECQYNHIMWYTTKNRHLLDTTGGNCSTAEALAGLCTWAEDGNLFSPQSSALLQWNSFAR